MSGTGIWFRPDVPASVKKSRHLAGFFFPATLIAGVHPLQGTQQGFRFGTMTEVLVDEGVDDLALAVDQETGGHRHLVGATGHIAWQVNASLFHRICHHFGQCHHQNAGAGGCQLRIAEQGVAQTIASLRRKIEFGILTDDGDEAGAERLDLG